MYRTRKGYINHINVVEVCNSEYFKPSCPANYVILIDSALYGRMRSGRCISGVHGNTGCHMDVTAELDARCSGRRECSVYGADQTLGQMNPCSNDLMPYLQVTHSCVKGRLR